MRRESVGRPARCTPAPIFLLVVLPHHRDNSSPSGAGAGAARQPPFLDQSRTANRVFTSSAAGRSRARSAAAPGPGAGAAAGGVVSKRSARCRPSLAVPRKGGRACSPPAAWKLATSACKHRLVRESTVRSSPVPYNCSKTPPCLHTRIALLSGSPSSLRFALAQAGEIPRYPYGRIYARLPDHDFCRIGSVQSANYLIINIITDCQSLGNGHRYTRIRRVPRRRRWFVKGTEHPARAESCGLAARQAAPRPGDPSRGRLGSGLPEGRTC